MSYHVIKESYPSGNGCYAGQDLDDDYIEACTTKKIIGEYATLKEAQKAARKCRDYTEIFDDWAEDYYKKEDLDKARLTHYSSADCDDWDMMADEDEHVSIFILDLDKEKAKKEAAMKHAKLNSKPPPKKKLKTTQERTFGRSTSRIKPDIQVFLRNPTKIQGGVQKLPTEYGNSARGDPKNSFAYLLQRLSDRNYAMRGLCVDGDGAQYMAFKKGKRTFPAWMPQTNLNDHHIDTTPSIVDTFHTDLVNSETGQALLTKQNLLEAVQATTDSLFINNFKKDADAIVQAIQKCQDSLQCASLVETTVSPKILDALTKCRLLKGLIISQIDNHGVRDEHFAKLLKALPALAWLYVEGGNYFETQSWKALQGHGALEVLWIDVTTTKEGRADKVRGCVHTARQTLKASKAKLLMVNPDDKLTSRYVAGQQKDRLEGKKTKTPDQILAEMERRMMDGDCDW